MSLAGRPRLGGHLNCSPGHSLLAAVLGALALAGSSGSGRAITIRDDVALSAGGIGNYFDRSNSYPNVVGLFLQASPGNTGENCTGTLIDSRTVLTAAHCLVNAQGVNNLTQAYRISFSPTGATPATSDRLMSGGLALPTYRGGDNDVALISLATPVTNITPVQLLKPGGALPQVGNQVLVVGYGLSGTGSTGATNDDGKRRVAQTSLGNIDNEDKTFQIQFRNPSSPTSPDQFGLATLGIPVRTQEGNVAGGDSGGPLFLVTPNGLIEIGTVIGGRNSFNPSLPTGYGRVEDYAQIQLQLYADFIAQNDPLRQVFAVDGIFNWGNPTAWANGVVPNNTDGTVTGTLSLGRYYQVTLANNGTITLDMNPTIDSLTVSGASSQLALPVNSTLTTVVSTKLSAGTVRLAGGNLVSPEIGITGGLLTGFGTITAAGGSTGVCNIGVCNTGGILAPRASMTISSMTIKGNYTQGAAGTLSITAGSNTADQLSVSGTATLGGTLSVTLVPQVGSIADNTSYYIVTAGARSGTFAGSATSSLSAVITGSIVYSGNTVKLDLTRTASYSDVAKSGSANETAQNFAATLDQVRGRDDPPTDMNLVLAELDTANASDAVTFFDEASGEGTGDSDVVSNQLAAEQATARLVQGIVEGHLAALRDGSADIVQRAAGLRHLTMAYAGGSGLAFGSGGDGGAGDAYGGDATASTGPGPPGSLWAQGIGAWQTIRADSNSAGVSQSVGGVIVGIDVAALPAVQPGLHGGFAFSYTHGNLGSGADSGIADVYRGAVYATQAFGSGYIDAQLGYGYGQLSSLRRIDTSDIGIVRAAAGSSGGSQWSASLAAGYRYSAGSFLLEPSVGLTWDRVGRGAYTETGADSLDLSLGASSLDSLRVSAGIRATAKFALGNGMVVQPELRARYSYETLAPVPTTTAELQGAPGLPFTLTGVDIGRSAAVLGGGITLARGKSFALFADCDAELRSHESVYAVLAGSRFAW